MGKKPPFGRLSALWHRDGAALIQVYTPLAERVARSYDRRFPGIDWPPVIFDALYLAAFTFDAAKCPKFHRWMQRKVQDLASSHIRTFLRRREKLTRHPVWVVDPWCEQLLSGKAGRPAAPSSR